MRTQITFVILAVLFGLAVAHANPYDKPSKWATDGAQSAFKEGTVKGDGHRIGWQKPCTVERTVYIIRDENRLVVQHCDGRVDALRKELVDKGVLPAEAPTPATPATPATGQEQSTPPAATTGKPAEGQEAKPAEPPAPAGSSTPPATGTPPGPTGDQGPSGPPAAAGSSTPPTPPTNNPAGGGKPAQSSMLNLPGGPGSGLLLIGCCGYAVVAHFRKRRSARRSRTTH